MRSVEPRPIRGSVLPLCYQPQQALRQSIESGERAPGDRLPGERELMRTFNVSRTTVRSALDALEREGLIVRIHGRGTFVAPRPVVTTLARLQGFTEELREQGVPFDVKVVRSGTVRAPREAAEALGLQPGAEVAVIARVVMVDGEPLFTDESFLLPVLGRLVLAAEPGETVYSTIEAIGFPMVKGEQTIEAAAASPVEARQLRIRPGDPVLVVRRIARVVDGTAVEFRRVVFRGDRYRYRMELVRRAASGGAPRLDARGAPSVALRRGYADESGEATRQASPCKGYSGREDLDAQFGGER